MSDKLRRGRNGTIVRAMLGVVLVGANVASVNAADAGAPEILPVKVAERQPARPAKSGGDTTRSEPNPRILLCGGSNVPSVAQAAARPMSAALQTMLARCGFSPGLIDGKEGRKTKIAIEAFQRSAGIEPTGEWDAATGAELVKRSKLADPGEWTMSYTITDRDEGLITGPIPEDWNERAQLAVSGYADMEELLAERGWCSVGMVRQLNPSVELNGLKAGESVKLPDVRVGGLGPVAEVEIDLGEKLVKAMNADGAVVMLTHCSIAREMEKRPVGELKVTVVATDPEYTFDPAVWPEVQNVESKLRIAPGPRNPVGSAWIGLNRPGYGMHGTVRPADIGKTGSHGCFRLTNWDASRLARAVKIGTIVRVVE